MHHGLGLFAAAALLVFVFGAKAARIIIGGGLAVAALAFAYVMFRIVTGTV